MADAFGVVPEELVRAADSIDEAVADAGHLLWQGPSGDYGHAGVQAGWAGFIGEVKDLVTGLAGKARGHGDDLRVASALYRSSDEAAGSSISLTGVRALEALGGSGDSSSSGGRIMSGLGGLLRDEGGAAVSEHWTGGATGHISGSIDDPAGVLSPRRSQELFPGSSQPAEEADEGEGPIF